MTLTLSKSALKPNLLHYLRNLERDKEPLIITDRGRAIAKIIPYSEHEGEHLKTLRGSVLHYEDPFEPVANEDWTLLP